MPPIVSWYRGVDAIEVMFRAVAFAHRRSWRMLPTSANGQLAVGTYERDSSGLYAPHGVTVLTLRGNKIDEKSPTTARGCSSGSGFPRGPDAALER